MRRSVLAVALIFVLSAYVPGSAAFASLAQNTSTSAPVLPPELVGSVHMRWGSPGGACTILPKQFYVICHDGSKRVPQWVTYHLGTADLRANVKRTDSFRPDPELPKDERAELADYKDSGYDRGHMAPAADFRRSGVAMSETFFLSNMAPQRPNLNRHIWERLESQVRDLARVHGSVWIVTGPLYLDPAGTHSVPSSKLMHDRVAIPTHFFKVVLCEHADGTHEAFAFIMLNQVAPFTDQPGDHLVTVDRVERLSGLDFFAALPDSEEDRLESHAAPRWPVVTSP